MGWIAGKTTFECAEPQSMIASVPGACCTLAVVQMCWMEERPGGKASGLGCLFRSCGWMMLGQINCTQDFPFQTTLGNVRSWQGRVILTVGWQLQWGDKWYRHGERETRVCKLPHTKIARRKMEREDHGCWNFSEYWFSKSIYLCYDAPSPITLLMLCYVKSSSSWLVYCIKQGTSRIGVSAWLTEEGKKINSPLPKTVFKKIWNPTQTQIPNKLLL